MSKPLRLADLQPSIDEILAHIPLTDLFRYIGEYYTEMGINNKDSRCILAGGKVLDLSSHRILKRLAEAPSNKKIRAELQKIRRVNNLKRFDFGNEKGEQDDSM